MPRWRLIRALLHKEFLDVFRDKSTLFVNYGIPLLLYPAALALFSEAILMRAVSENDRGHHAVLVGTDAPFLSRRLSKLPQIKWETLSAADRSRLEALLTDYTRVGPFPAPGSGTKAAHQLRRFLKERKLDAIVSVKPVVSADREFPVNQLVRVIFDKNESTADAVVDSLGWTLTNLSYGLRAERMRAKGLSETLDKPITLTGSDLATADSAAAGEAMGGEGAPYLLFLFLILATYYPSLQTLTAERERGTLASLLSTSLTPWETILAKFLLVFFSAVSSLTMHAVSLATLYRLLPRSPVSLPTFHQFPLLLLTVFSAAALIAALCLGAATIAKTRNEGEALLATLLMLALTPAIFVPLAGIGLGWGPILMPLVNVSVVFKEIVQAPLPLPFLIAAILSNLAGAAVLLAFAAQLFSREVVLFRGEGSFAELLALNRRAIKEPSPALSGLLFFLMLMPIGYLGLALSAGHPLLTLPLLQIGLILGLPLLIAHYFRFNLREVFSWYRPKAKQIAAALILGLSLPLLMVSVMSHLPIPEEYAEEFAKSLGISDGRLSPILMLVAFALLPAICEEVAYRGMILAGFLKRFSPAWSIVLTGCLFGLNHFSAFRFLPTTLVGLVLSYTVWRTRSLPLSMTVHAIYNASLFLFSADPARFHWLGIHARHVSLFTGLAGAVGMAIGLCLLRSRAPLPGDRLPIAEEPPRRAAIR